MAGPRDDGSFAEDKAHHPNRKVSNMEDYRILKKSRQFEAMRNHPAYKGHPDDANPYGIERPKGLTFEFVDFDDLPADKQQSIKDRDKREWEATMKAHDRKQKRKDAREARFEEKLEIED